MSSYFYVTDFTVPAGTAIASPAVQVVTLDDKILDSIRFVIPDGHVGLTGVAVKSQGVNIAPYLQGTWLIANNEVVDFPYDALIAENQLQLWGYNLDVFPHTFHMRWVMSDIEPAGLPVDIASPQQSPPGPELTAAVASLAAPASLATITAAVPQTRPGRQPQPPVRYG